MRTAYFAIPLALLTGCVIRTGPGVASAPAAAAAPAPDPVAAPAAAPVAAPAAAPAPAPGPVVAAPPVAAPPPGPGPIFFPPPVGPVAPGITINGSIVVSTDPLPPNQPPVTEPPPAANPVPAAPGVVNGQPPNLKPGAGAAYWVWRDATGVWHLRTTSGKKLQRFHGKVTAVSGQVADVKPVKIEFKDRMVVGPKSITFSFDTAGAMDGFDFRITDNQCASFNLQKNAGKSIVVGGSEAQPASHHFTLCP